MSVITQLYDLSLLNHVFMNRVYPSRVNLLSQPNTMFISWLLYKLQKLFLLEYSNNVYVENNIPFNHRVEDFRDSDGNIREIIERVFTTQLVFIRRIENRHVKTVKYNPLSKELLIQFEDTAYEHYHRHRRLCR
jgi:hypothetical protein